eukprot:11412982-Alexandrium_andersonii.AAC.1
MSSGRKIQPEGAAAPARPTSQTALLAAPNRLKWETPFLGSKRRRRRATCGASCAWQGGTEISDVRRFGAAGNAVWHVGRSGTVAPSGR